MKILTETSFIEQLQNEDSKSKDFPVDVSVKLRMGELDTAANSQEIVSHTSILFMTVVTFTLTYTLRYW